MALFVAGPIAAILRWDRQELSRRNPAMRSNNAPMMMIDHVYYENLTPEKVDQVLDGLK